VRNAVRAVVATIVCSGVLTSAAHAPAAGPVRLSIGTTDAIGSIDPRRGSSAVAQEVWNLQYPTLVALDQATLEPIPGVARSWTPAADGRGWRYVLGDTTWSDGTPLTADDVVYSFTHARADHWPYAGSTLAGLQVRKVDAHTVDVTSTTGRPSTLLPVLLLHVVPAHVFSRVTDLDRDFDAVSVGAGRWHVTGHDPDEVRLAAIDGPARPPIDEIRYTRAPSDALASALTAGDLDAVSGLRDRAYRTLQDTVDVTTTHANDGAQYALLMNTRHGGAAADPAFRQAVAATIDRETLATDAVPDGARPQSGLAAARAVQWRLPDTSAPAPASSAPPANVTWTATLYADPADAVARRIAGALTRQLPGATTADAAAAADLVVVRHPATDDPAPMLAELTCAAGHWCDASFDAAHARFVQSNDPAERQALAQQMLRRAAAQNAELALLAPDVRQAFRSDHISGWLREPTQQRLIAFGPSVQQYDQLLSATAPPGETPGNAVLLAGFLVLAGGCVVLYLVAVWIRRRHALR
jgi:ABC-type transport system substrate-binding protein